jgi:hypothetical protein
MAPLLELEFTLPLGLSLHLFNHPFDPDIIVFIGRFQEAFTITLTLVELAAVIANSIYKLKPFIPRSEALLKP